MTRDDRIPVAVLGATGSVGQRFIQLLAHHPWFRVTAVTASERSEGRPYGEVVRWAQAEAIPADVVELPVLPTEIGPEVPIVFSALDARVAGTVETEFASAGVMVVTNAGNHRMDSDVPLLVPEVNATHLELLKAQTFPDGGGILANPNCSTIGLVLPLHALHQVFSVRKVNVVTLQAISGAGIPGVSSVEILDNVVPFIGGEEEKLESETRKILGQLNESDIREADITVSAQCTRVPVLDGHLEMVSVALEGSPSPADVQEVLSAFRGEPQELELPSAPRRPIHVLEEESHPQPRLHRDLEGGMAVSVGRIRGCPLLGTKMVLLSHNTIRGAAGGAILCAELAVAQDRVSGVQITSWRRDTDD